MADGPTCGQGLAAMAALPEKLGNLEASVAENLETHLITLDLDDEAARREHDVWEKLAREHRRIAAELHAVAGEMAGYRDLRMGRHDEEALGSGPVVEAYHRFLAVAARLGAWHLRVAAQIVLQF